MQCTLNIAGIPLDIIFEDIDYSNPEIQQKMLKLAEEIEQSKFVESMDSIWLKSFLQDNPSYASGSSNVSAFYYALYQWLLTTNGRAHFPDIIFQYGSIKTSKFSGKHAALNTDFERADGEFP